MHFKMAEYLDLGNPRKRIKLENEEMNNINCNLANDCRNYSGDGQVIKSKVTEDGETPEILLQDRSQVTLKSNPSDMGEDDVNYEDTDEESNVSELSDMSDLSGEFAWKASSAGSAAWVFRCMREDVDPRSILRQIITDDANIPDVDDLTLWKLVITLVSEPPPRKKLPDFNTLDDVLRLLQTSQKIIVLTGAGVSVSSGIPDFRSRNGVYARLAVDFPDLPDPQAMFDIHYFRKDQRPFFKFAKEIYPGQFEPSKCHKFIRLLETHSKLLRNYTQNIDTLEQVTGIQNVIQCHGSFASATCMTCNHTCTGADIEQKIMDQVIPVCPVCNPKTELSIMKPDIVFFGESLPEKFHQQMTEDKDNCDLMIVIGSSLKVRPVALIPNSLPSHVPQILINKEHLRNLNFDVELLGDCDTIVGELCRRLGKGWECLANDESLTEISLDMLQTPPMSPHREEIDSNPEHINDNISEDPVSGSEHAVQRYAKVEMSATVDMSHLKPVDGSHEIDGSAKTERNYPMNVSVDVSHLPHKTTISDICTEPKTAGSFGRATNIASCKPAIHLSKESAVGMETQIASDNHSGSEQITNASDVNINGIDEISPETKANDAITNSIDNLNTDSKECNGCTNEGAEIEAGSSRPETLWELWCPYRENIAKRLPPHQFCFIPPCRYVFPEAEYYIKLTSDSDTDDRETDTTSDTDSDLDNSQNTGSSGRDGDTIGLASGDVDKDAGNHVEDDDAGDHVDDDDDAEKLNGKSDSMYLVVKSDKTDLVVNNDGT